MKFAFRTRGWIAPRSASRIHGDQRGHRQFKFGACVSCCGNRTGGPHNAVRCVGYFGFRLDHFTNPLKPTPGLNGPPALATRGPAVQLSVDMLVALITVHMKNGFFVPSGIEFPLTLLAALICLAISGGGSFSRKAGKPRVRGKSAAGAEQSPNQIRQHCERENYQGMKQAVRERQNRRSDGETYPTTWPAPPRPTGGLV